MKFIVHFSFGSTCFLAAHSEDDAWMKIKSNAKHEAHWLKVSRLEFIGYYGERS